MQQTEHVQDSSAIAETDGIQTTPTPARIQWRRNDLLIIFFVSLVFAVIGDAIPDLPQFPGILSLAVSSLVGAGAIAGIAHWLGRRSQQHPTPAIEERNKTQTTLISTIIQWKKRDLLLIFCVSFAVSFIFVLGTSIYVSTFSLPEAISIAIASLVAAGATVYSLYWLRRWQPRPKRPVLKKARKTRLLFTSISWRWRDPLFIFCVSVFFTVASGIGIFLPQSFSAFFFIGTLLAKAGAFVGTLYWLRRLRSPEQEAFETIARPTLADIRWQWTDLLLIFCVSFASFISIGFLSALHLPRALLLGSLPLLDTIFLVGTLYWLGRQRLRHQRRHQSPAQEELATPGNIHWRVSDLLLIVPVSVTIETIGEFLFSTLHSTEALSVVNTGVWRLVAIVASVYWLGLRRRRRQNWAAIGVATPPWHRLRGIWNWIWLALLLEMLLHVVIAYTQVWFFPTDVNPQQDLLFPRGTTWVSTVGGILAISFFVPFAEELLFRGVIYRFIRERWGIWIGVIISAAVFGIAHGDPIVGINAGLGGIVYALVYERTKSLWSSIIMHSVGNFLVEVSVVYTLLSTHAKIPWL